MKPSKGETFRHCCQVFSRFSREWKGGLLQRGVLERASKEYLDQKEVQFVDRVIFQSKKARWVTFTVFSFALMAEKWTRQQATSLDLLLTTLFVGLVFQIDDVIDATTEPVDSEKIENVRRLDELLREKIKEKKNKREATFLLTTYDQFLATGTRGITLGLSYKQGGYTFEQALAYRRATTGPFVEAIGSFLGGFYLSEGYRNAVANLFRNVGLVIQMFDDMHDVADDLHQANNFSVAVGALHDSGELRAIQQGKRFSHRYTPEAHARVMVQARAYLKECFEENSLYTPLIIDILTLGYAILARRKR